MIVIFVVVDLGVWSVLAVLHWSCRQSGQRVQRFVQFPRTLEHSDTTQAHTALYRQCLFHLRRVQDQTQGRNSSLFFFSKIMSTTISCEHFCFSCKQSSTVDVFYVFETQKLVQRPGLTRFRQQWLNDIIKLKETLVNDCKFWTHWPYTLIWFVLFDVFFITPYCCCY